MQKTKELMDVPGFKDQKIVIKRLNYGEKADIQDYAMDIKFNPMQGRQQDIGVGVSIGKTRLYTLVFGIVEAPFFNTKDVEQRYKIIRGIEQETGDYLYKEIDELSSSLISEDVIKK